MATGYFLVIGDKTTCGGHIISGCENHTFYGRATARNGDKYICGADGRVYHIAGGIPNYTIHGVAAAGTLHSWGTCSCRCRFIPSNWNDTYDFDSQPKLAAAPVAVPKPAPAPQAPKPAPATIPVVPEEEPRVPVDAGFCVLKFGATPSSYEPWFFVKPPAGTTELFRKLNPERKKQPGSILLVVDPEKQDAEQIKTMEKARDRIDAALEPLTLDEARLLHDNRAAVDIFSSQIFNSALGVSSNTLGYASELGGAYYEEINNTLKEIQKLYQDTYSSNHGIISGQEFLGQRQRLFNKLDVILNRYTKSHLGLAQYDSIKKSLGLSTSSIMHKWDQTGIDDIEGYATYIENSAKLIKVMRNVGYVGIGLDFASYSSNVYDACSKGRKDACKKAALVEYGKFGGKQIVSYAAGGIAGWAARSVCLWALGLVTAEAGGIGAGLCLVTGIGASIAGGDFAQDSGENAGKFLGGEIIYEKLFDGK